MSATRFDRREFLQKSLAGGFVSAMGSGLLPLAWGEQTLPRDKALVAITLDLEMSRNFPAWETTHWDYEKGNLDSATKEYTVEACRRVKERGGIVQLPPPPRFRPGERLTITQGSLKYRSVIYAGMSGRDRERVLIEMLGQYVSIRVPTAHLASEFAPPTRNRLRKNRETFIGQRVASHRATAARSN